MKYYDFSKLICSYFALVPKLMILIDIVNVLKLLA